MPKAFIIFRDRVTYARRCYAALAAAGLDVHVVDHDSSWPAALLWLADLEKSGVTVLRRGGNAYPWKLWEWDRFRAVLWGDGEPYLVTDPDVVPSDDCPRDWLARLAAVLARPGCVKAGLGLRLDRLPLSRRAQVTGWESRFWADEPEPGVFRANVDTTLALYRPYTEYPLFSLGPAVRLGHPFVADHLSWYEEGDLPPELRHYYGRADPGHSVTGRTVRLSWRHDDAAGSGGRGDPCPCPGDQLLADDAHYRALVFLAPRLGGRARVAGSLLCRGRHSPRLA
jgi:hypothetical protein